MLTPSLVRVEQLKPSATVSWDDRATLQVTNRRLPVPTFTTTNINASAMQVTTSALKITLQGGGAAAQCTTQRGLDWQPGTKRSASCEDARYPPSTHPLRALPTFTLLV